MARLGSWTKWAKGLFKAEKPLGSEPWFNPEDVTQQKREWIETQGESSKPQLSWPQHIYEHFVIVGLPPDVEVTQIAEELCELERKQRHAGARSDAASEWGDKEHKQAPHPAYAPEVIYRYPADVPAPISDAEIASLCFPHQVAPSKLRRTPSFSSLNEIVYGRQNDSDDQCFVFELRVAGNFPLYGVCWHVEEMLHRPPYLARSRYSACKAPYRQCLISAPRCYCLLTHYPFFELHFKLLQMVLDLERLERLLEYDHERSSSSVSATGDNMPSILAAQARQQHERQRLGQQQPEADKQSSAATAAASAPQQHQHAHDPEQEQHHLPPAGHAMSLASASSSPVPRHERYCAECLSIIEDMVPCTPAGGAGRSRATSSRDRAQRAPSLRAPWNPQQPWQGEAEGQLQHQASSGTDERRCEVCGRAVAATPTADATAAGLPPILGQAPARAALMPGEGAAAASLPAAAAAAAAAPRQMASAGSVNSAFQYQPQALPQPVPLPAMPPQSTPEHPTCAGLSAVSPQSQPAPRAATPEEAAGFDAAAQIPFDGAALVSGEERWAWRGMVGAIKAAGHKLVTDGSTTLGLNDAADPSSVGGGSEEGRGGGSGLPRRLLEPQVSMVQRMWDTWALSPHTMPSPKQPSGSLSRAFSRRCTQSQGGAPVHGAASDSAAPTALGSCVQPPPPPRSQSAAGVQQVPQRASSQHAHATRALQPALPGRAAPPADSPRDHCQKGWQVSSSQQECQDRPGCQWTREQQEGSLCSSSNSTAGVGPSQHPTSAPQPDAAEAAVLSSHMPEAAVQGSPSSAQEHSIPGPAGSPLPLGLVPHHMRHVSAADSFHTATEEVHADAQDDVEDSPHGVAAFSSHGDTDDAVTGHEAAEGTAAQSMQQQQQRAEATAMQQQHEQQQQQSLAGSPSSQPSVLTPHSNGIVSAFAELARHTLQPSPVPGEGASVSRHPCGQLQRVASSRDDCSEGVDEAEGGVAGAVTLSGRSSRRQVLAEAITDRRSQELSVQLQATVLRMAEVDSDAVLRMYRASDMVPPGDTYRLYVGDLYRLEFLRPAPSTAFCVMGRLPSSPLAFAEAECAEQLLWAVAALCRSLSLENILTLINAALLEKQAVVFCPNIGILSAVVLSLMPLLRPFTWQSLLLPVTPLSMLGFLEAPVPFVLGVQYKTYDVASKCHGLLRVNVYKDAIKHATFPSMPNARRLLQALAPAHAALRAYVPLAVQRPVHIISADEAEAARAFLSETHAFLAVLCGDLRLHTITNVGMSKRTGLLMVDSLIDSFPAKDRTFIRQFTETQMFAAYSDAVVDAVITAPSLASV